MARHHRRQASDKRALEVSSCLEALLVLLAVRAQTAYALGSDSVVVFLFVLNEQASVCVFTVAHSLSILRALGAPGSVLPAFCKPSSTAQTMRLWRADAVHIWYLGASPFLPGHREAVGVGCTLRDYDFNVLSAFTSQCLRFLPTCGDAAVRHDGFSTYSS